MSWIKENYEKAALGGAAAILLGAVGVSVLGGGDKPDAQPKKFTADDSVDVPAQVDVSLALEERSTPAKIAKKVEGLRQVDLFVGQALYMKDGSSNPIDLHESESVHEGIPNIFWQKYGIDPTFANAAARDFDKDGFTNLEEHQAGTSPIDNQDHPSAMTKLVGRNVELFKMQMRWSAFDDTSISLSYQDNKKLRSRGRVTIGSTFLESGSEAVKGRFVLGEKKEGVKRPNDDRLQEAYEVTDTSPLYKGTEREKFLLYKTGEKPGGYNELQDRTVTLTLNALGKEAEQFTVAENQSFSLPFDATAKEQPYKVESIVPKAGSESQFTVTISEIKGGKKVTKELSVANR